MATFLYILVMFDAFSQYYYYSNMLQMLLYHYLYVSFTTIVCDATSRACPSSRGRRHAAAGRGRRRPVRRRFPIGGGLSVKMKIKIENSVF